MPFTQVFDEHSQMFRTTITGVVTFNDLREHLLTRCQAATLACREIIDARGAQPVGLSFKDMLWTANHMRSQLGQGQAARRAVIVDGDASLQHARILASLTAGWMRLGIFDNVDAAENWLLERTTPMRVSVSSAV